MMPLKTGTPEKTAAIRREFLRFSLVGGVGFLVDTATLAIYLMIMGDRLYSGRIFAWFTAVTVNWALNRRFTFDRSATKSATNSPATGGRIRARFHQWLRFVAVNSGGGLVNLTLYVVLVNQIPFCHTYPITAQAAGVAGGLVLNFTGSRRLVFTHAGTAIGSDQSTP